MLKLNSKVFLRLAGGKDRKKDITLNAERNSLVLQRVNDDDMNLNNSIFH